MENENKIETSADTIFALASGQGRAGVAIIRISGPAAKKTLVSLTKRRLPNPRQAVLRVLFSGLGEKIDEALVLLFKGPASFTGEDMVELQTHGSPAVIEGVSAALYALGLRQANAGEFTRRAFENGKMDLTEAEGLADLIDAETSGQRQQALRQMQGGLRDVYQEWRSQILDALVFIEGEIDFPDEADVPEELAHKATAGLKKLGLSLRRTLEESFRGERVRHGLDIAIIGAPNAGKSSIINYLAGKNAAIVSAIPGTTRDIVEVHMTISGVPTRFSDTAGLRAADDEIEAEGIRRARARAKDADIRLAVIDNSITGSHKSLFAQLEQGDFVLVNKMDLEAKGEPLNVSRETFYISATTGEGFEGFISALEGAVASRFGSSEQAGLTRSRHVFCVKKALEAVEKAQESLDIAPELAGADLREALHAIKELAGETDIEAVLDRVFSSFCIGK